MKRFMVVLVLAGLVAACQPQRLVVEKTLFRPPLGSAETGAAYFTIRSPVADRIVAVSSTQAAAVEIHASVSSGGMMGMEHLDGVDLPAGKDVIFGPGGLHLMVFSPQPMGPDATFPITIQLESGTTTTIGFQGAAKADKLPN